MKPRRKNLSASAMVIGFAMTATLSWAQTQSQTAMLERGFDWRLGLAWGLAGVCVLLLVYLGTRLAYLTTRYSRLEKRLDTMARLPSDAATSENTVLQERETSAADWVSPISTSYPVRRPIPRVQFVSGVIDRLVDGINASRRLRGDAETGYALVGKIMGQGESRVLLVNGLIDEGPAAERSSGYHKSDRKHQQLELELLQCVDHDVLHIGDAHLHPDFLDVCSDGDYQTDLGNVRDSRGQEMVFIIATAASARRDVRSAKSLYRDGLKLDFFYLGRSSGYHYRSFKPEIVDGQPLQVGTQLRRFTQADPLRARLDLENLRNLTAYQMTILELAFNGQPPRPCIRMRHRSRGFKTIIAFTGDPKTRPEVYIDAGSELLRYQPEYLDGRWTDLIWFTPIVLEVEREMASRLGFRPGSHNHTPTDERSAPVVTEFFGPSGAHDHGNLSATKQRASGGDSTGDGPVSIRGPRCGLQRDR